MLTKGKWFAIGLGLTIFVAGFTFGVVLYYYQFSFDRALDYLRNSPVEQLEQAQPQEVIEEVLALEANLMITMIYEDGCEEILPARMVPPDLVGMSRERVASTYQQWAITNFSPQELIVEKQAGTCPFHSQKYLGIANGYVAIFQGKPDREGVVLRKTNVLLRTIPLSERNNLMRGIPVQDEEEALLILEGLNENTGRI